MSSNNFKSNFQNILNKWRALEEESKNMKKNDFVKKANKKESKQPINNQELPVPVENISNGLNKEPTDSLMSTNKQQIISKNEKTIVAPINLKNNSNGNKPQSKQNLNLKNNPSGKQNLNLKNNSNGKQNIKNNSNGKQNINNKSKIVKVVS